MATHLERQGAEDRALTLYRIAAREEPAPWREWALLRAATLLSEEEAHREIVELLRGEEAARRYPALAYRYGSALYELNRYEELLTFIAEYEEKRLRIDVMEPFGSPELEEEMLLWESVAYHQRGDLENAVSRARELFVHGSLSSRVNRLFLYFNYYDLLDRLEEGLVELLQARLVVDERRWREAANRFIDVHPRHYSEESLYDAYRAFLNARYFAAGSRFFQHEDIPRELADRADYYAGALLLSGRSYRDALESFERGLQGEGSFPKDLLRRQLLRAAASLGRDELAAVVPGMLREARPEELRPTLEEGVHFLSRGGNGAAEAVRLFLEAGEPGTAAHVAVAASQGLWPGVSVGLSELLDARDQSEELFYRFMAQAILPEEHRVSPEELLLLERRQEPDGSDEEAPSPEGTREENRLPLREEEYRRLLTFGLQQEAYELGLIYANHLSRETVDKAAAELQESGRYYEALRLMHRRGYQTSVGTRERAELLYPQAHDDLIRTAAEKEDIDTAFWYAVVREESFFSSSVASHAGAVGLSQLMPTTAADVAGRMGLLEPVLTDPETNLSIGARYLRMLLDRFERSVPALAAYNAGQGRVRRWLAESPAGMLAFHERIPFWETRHHVRKVVVSAVYYNYLYQNVRPEETVRFFFPELQELDG
ncbi:MAG: flagellar assembly lytic transglycosylase [Alkalispirochaetaceae bacterium]